MNTKRIIASCALAVTLVVAAIALLFLRRVTPQKTQTITSPTAYVFAPTQATSAGITVATESFVPWDMVKRALAGVTVSAPCKAYRAGIVNHHALASDLLAKSAKTLEACRPDLETLVIISPDHFYRGTQALTTAIATYRTDSLTVKTDAVLQQELLEAVPTMGQQPDVFKKEHGIAALVPFYAHEFNDLKIVPITVKGHVSEAEAKSLTDWLEKTLKRPKTFVLISADMSHYLSKEQALANDEKTLRALGQNDAAFFADASDDFTDSGVQIALILKALGRTTWHTVDHKISTDYTNDRSNTTSYIMGFWE
ncbi:MAG: AmmeMemoRadiSam system protein B [Patescibacteria group bacterium]